MTAHALLDHVPEALRVELADSDRNRVVSVRGELDLASAPTLERTLTTQARRAGPLVLDLRGVAFVDACGLAVLLRAASDAGRARCILTLIPGDAVIRLLTLCGLHARFRYTEAPPT